MCCLSRQVLTSCYVTTPCKKGEKLHGNANFAWIAWQQNTKPRIVLVRNVGLGSLQTTTPHSYTKVVGQIHLLIKSSTNAQSSNIQPPAPPKEDARHLELIICCFIRCPAKHQPSLCSASKEDSSFKFCQFRSIIRKCLLNTYAVLEMTRNWLEST